MWILSRARSDTTVWPSQSSSPSRQSSVRQEGVRDARRQMASATTAPPRLGYTSRRCGTMRRARRWGAVHATARTRGTTSRPLDMVSTTLIVDDLVFHDGSTKMAVLGGGGPQSLFGAGLARRDPPLTLGLIPRRRVTAVHLPRAPPSSWTRRGTPGHPR